MRRGAKCAECLFFGFPIVFYIGALYGIVIQMIALSIDIRSDLNSFTSMVNKIHDSIKAGPVYDIHPTKEITCPGGFERFDLGTWAGTSQGCYSSLNNTLLRDNCHKHHINATDSAWKDVQPENARLYYKWRDVTFCRQRFQDYMLMNQSNDSCPEGYKLCNLKYCVESSHGCFVTSFQVQHDPETGAIGISVSRDANSLAISGVKLSTGGNPCFDSTKSPKQNNTYILLNKYGAGCEPYGEDNLTKIVDTSSEYDILASHGLDNMINKLPGYEKYSKSVELDLYYSRQPNVSWSNSCQLFNYTDMNEKFKHFNMPFVSMNLIAYSIVGIIFVISTIIFICVDKEEADRERFERDQRCLYHTFHCLPYLMGILFISEANAIPRIERTPLNGILIGISELLAQNCFNDEMYNQVLLYIKQFLLKTAYDMYHPTRMLEIWSWVCIGILLLLRGYRAYYRRDVEVFENEYLELRYYRQDLSRANEQNEQHQDFEDDEGHNH